MQTHTSLNIYEAPSNAVGLFRVAVKNFRKSGKFKRFVNIVRGLPVPSTADAGLLWDGSVGVAVLGVSACLFCRGCGTAVQYSVRDISRRTAIRLF